MGELSHKLTGVYSPLSVDLDFPWVSPYPSLSVLVGFPLWYVSFAVLIDMTEVTGSQLQSLGKFYKVVFGCNLISFNVRRPSVWKGRGQFGKYPH